MFIDVSLTTPMKTGQFYGRLKTDKIKENNKVNKSKSAIFSKKEEGYTILYNNSLYYL